ncbi:MAG: methyltransferase, TIGR04325 family [bacterium]
MSLAPITIFVYNRPLHIKQTIEALKKNQFANESELFIFSDGQKDERDQKKVEEVRKYLWKITGFKKITIIERRNNVGLANSIIAGVTEIVNKYGKIIVLEDDLLTSPYFLKFMNEGLNYYEKEKRVASIHGYVYPIKAKLTETFFIQGADCWGWATWKRGWDLFERDGKKLLAELKKKDLTHKFDFGGSYPYTKMLIDQVNGKNNSWAIRWYASAFLKGKLTVYPKRPLIFHNGNDESGTNVGKSHELDVELSQRPIKISKIPLKESKEALKIITAYFKLMYSKKRWHLKNYVISKLLTISNIVLKKIITIYNPYGWFGNYSSWEDAEKKCTGYESDIILEKVKNSLLKVKEGEAVYERDSVLFNHIEYSWPLLTGLMWIAAKSKNKLNIIDFGGSLGSTYFQNRIFLKELDELHWNIVEQKKFVDCGKKYFTDKQLKFYYDIETCLRENHSNVILFSSVIQYLNKPYQFLEKILNYNFQYIIFDNTAFTNTEADRITIQKVSPKIYEASYPSWFFNKEKFLILFKEKYELIAEFQSPIISKIHLGNTVGKYQGFIFRLNKENT